MYISVTLAFSFIPTAYTLQWNSTPIASSLQLAPYFVPPEPLRRIFMKVSDKDTGQRGSCMHCQNSLWDYETPDL